MPKQKISNKTLCDGCDECCRHVAVEIDKPTTKNDFENIKWYVAHKNVNVYVDWDNDWHIEFMTPCDHLNQITKLCKIYRERPKICREYSQVDCVRHSDGTAEKYYFKNLADIKKHLAKKAKRKKARAKK